MRFAGAALLLLISVSSVESFASPSTLKSASRPSLLTPSALIYGEDGTVSTEESSVGPAGIGSSSPYAPPGNILELYQQRMQREERDRLANYAVAFSDPKLGLSPNNIKDVQLLSLNHRGMEIQAQMTADGVAVFIPVQFPKPIDETSPEWLIESYLETNLEELDQDAKSKMNRMHQQLEIHSQVLQDYHAVVNPEDLPPWWLSQDSHDEFVTVLNEDEFRDDVNALLKFGVMVLEKEMVTQIVKARVVDVCGSGIVVKGIVGSDADIRTAMAPIPFAAAAAGSTVEDRVMSTITMAHDAVSQGIVLEGRPAAAVTEVEPVEIAKQEVVEAAPSELSASAPTFDTQKAEIAQRSLLEARLEMESKSRSAKPADVAVAAPSEQNIPVEHSSWPSHVFQRSLLEARLEMEAQSASRKSLENSSEQAAKDRTTSIENESVQRSLLVARLEIEKIEMERAAARAASIRNEKMQRSLLEAQLNVVRIEMERAAAREASIRNENIQRSLLKTQLNLARIERERAEARAASIRNEMMQRSLLETRLVLDQAVLERKLAEAKLAADIRSELMQRSLLVAHLDVARKERLRAASIRNESIQRTLLQARLEQERAARAREEARARELGFASVRIMQARMQPKSMSEAVMLSKKYSSMTDEERAFAILSDLGMIGRME